MALSDVAFTEEQAAEMAGIGEPLLHAWLACGSFTTDTYMRSEILGRTQHYFSQADLARLIEFAGRQGNGKRAKQNKFIDDGSQDSFTTAQIAAIWELSRDTIQRWFEDEPGVIVSGDKNPRGKRRRITLRIPRAVMDRVKKRRSNPS